jgi:hypothetical protein
MSDLLQCYKKYLLDPQSSNTVSIDNRNNSPNSNSSSLTFQDSLHLFLKHQKHKYNGLTLHFSDTDINDSTRGALEMTWYSHKYGLAAHLAGKTKEAERTIKSYQSRRLYSEVIWDLKRACCIDQSAGIVCNGKIRLPGGEVNPSPPSLKYVESVFAQSRISPVEKATFVDNKSRSALTYLSMTGNSEAIKYVYDLAPYMLYVQDLKSTPPIVYAVRFGSLETVKYYIECDEMLLVVVWEPCCLDLVSLAKSVNRSDIAQFLERRSCRLKRWLDRRELVLAHSVKTTDRVKDATSTCIRNVDTLRMIAGYL